MKKGIFTVKSNKEIAPSVFRMLLAGDISDITAPGQFINISLDGFYLRRPISVCDLDEAAATVTIIYKVVGGGTEYMSGLGCGAALDILTGLGNGFTTDNAGNEPLLVGGGVGAPPMLLLAKRLAAESRRVTAILGFGKKSEVFLKNELTAAGASVIITTVDGSEGTRGFVTDALALVPHPSFVFACGPEPMLRAVYDNTFCGAQLSFEERMGCGFGACMGCSCKTKYGAKRICRDGPVLTREEIIW